MLTRNPDAVQIGLTATPRQLDVTEKTKEALADAAINADNLRHFGEPVYEYDMGQGIEDGYLAACEIVRRDIFLDGSPFAERETGVDRDDLAGKQLIDAFTGEPVDLNEVREHYDAESFEALLLMPERVAEMCADLFAHLVATGGPEQKTIVFCARDQHADARGRRAEQPLRGLVRGQRLQARRALRLQVHRQRGRRRVHRRPQRRPPAPHFIATTVDLLTTGVDVPPRAQHRLLQVRALADRLLPDGRPRHAARPAHRQAHVPRLRLHRRHAPLRRGLHDRDHRPPRKRARRARTSRPSPRPSPRRPSWSRASTCASTTTAPAS